MLFGRKYVFETKATRARRAALNALVAMIAAGVVYCSFLGTIIYVSKSEHQRASEAFFQKSPDAIVVYTGDQGRIARALVLMKRNPSAKLLISGVHGKNSLQTLLYSQLQPGENTKELEALDGKGVQVDLDYDSKNTLGNVRETLEHLSQAQKDALVLVVSSDYHIFRIRMILDALNESVTPRVFYDSVPSDWSNFDDVKILLKESIKIVRAWFVLNFSSSKL